MKIERSDLLKTWLIKELTPICDADPDPLAKYVVALLKKDKDAVELKKVCLDQLEVFLQAKTSVFVDTLFKQLDLKEYLEQEKEIEKSRGIGVPDSTTPAAPVQSGTSVSSSKSEVSKEKAPNRRRDRDDADAKNSLNKEQLEKDRGDIKRRLGSRSPSPRRRDVDDRRRRFERTAGRIPEERRYYRRRSTSPRPRSPRRYSRSPIRGRSPFRRRMRSRSRSPRGRSRSFSPRSRSRSWSRSRSPYSRSRSKSWERGRRRDSRGPTPTLENGNFGPNAIQSVTSLYSNASTDSRYTHESSSHIAQTRPRCTDYDEKGFCMRGDLCPFDHGADPVVVENSTHPPPPNFSGPPPSSVSIPPGPPPPGPPFMSTRPQMLGPLPGQGPMARIPRPPGPDPFAYNPEAPSMNRPPIPPPFWQGPPPSSQPPVGGPRGPLSGPPPFLNQPPPGMGGPRPLAQQPPVDARDIIVSMRTEQAKEKDVLPPGTDIPESTDRTVIAPKRPFNNAGQSNRDNQPPRKKPFDYNRVGGYKQYEPPDLSNTTLQVTNIPKGSNTIVSINEHFGKFGELTNIKIGTEKDSDSALVSFKSNDQALAAYRSTEPVFNNRFVKVFWHKPEKEMPKSEDNQPSSSGQGSYENSQKGDVRNVKASAKSRLGVVIPPANKLSLDNTKPKITNETEDTPSVQHSDQKATVYSPGAGHLTRTVYNPEALRAKAALSSPTAVQTASFVSKIEAIKRQEELKKEALRKKVELQKQKQQLLEKQLEQQKTLIQKLEKSKNMSESDKNSIKETLKVLESSIGKLKSELLAKPVEVDVSPESQQETRKEILDTELELFNKQSAGEDTSELQKKLMELSRKAAKLGILGGRGRGRGRGRGAFGRGRGATTWVARGMSVPHYGRGRGIGRGFPHQGGRSLDNRPKTLEITGFDEQEKDDLVAHFGAQGEISKTEFGEEGTTALISFNTRQEAEKAVLHCSKFKDKVLAIQWHKPMQVKLGVSNVESFADEGDEEDITVGEDELDEDALLAPDEDEDEDEGSRSWRR